MVKYGTNPDDVSNSIVGFDCPGQSELGKHAILSAYYSYRDTKMTRNITFHEQMFRFFSNHIYL